MTEQGDRTRNDLLDAAERLFGARGISGVSLREVRIAAGARNTAALQFHFTDRAGLMDALIRRHLPRIAALQSHIEAEVMARPPVGSRELVEILVRPVTEYLTLGESERNWVKIMAELGTAPDVRLQIMQQFAPNAAMSAGKLVYAEAIRQIGELVARERMVLVAQIVVRSGADRARLIEEHEDGARISSDEFFVENLIDMVHGGLFAPVSERAAAQIADAQA